MRRNLIDGQWLTDTELTELFMRELAFESHRMVPNDPREIVQERRGRVPNERDFCAVCGALCWADLCGDCKKKPVRQAAREASGLIHPRIQQKNARSATEGLDL